MPKIISQTVTINSNPNQVYEALMDSKKHAEFTGDDAEIDAKVGGKFMVWGDYIEGENLELEQDKKIVQKWRATDWPEDYYSTATFELEPEGENTKLTFTQTDVPDDNFESISQGWHDHYWDKLNEYFAK
jgi:activator of HSP90 ATPase